MTVQRHSTETHDITADDPNNMPLHFLLVWSTGSALLKKPCHIQTLQSSVQSAYCFEAMWGGMIWWLDTWDGNWRAIGLTLQRWCTVLLNETLKGTADPKTKILSSFTHVVPSFCYPHVVPNPQDFGTPIKICLIFTHHFCPSIERPHKENFQASKM